MNLRQQIFSYSSLILSLSLFSCSDCENVLLGEIELKGTLDAFTPTVSNSEEENLLVSYGNTTAGLVYQASMYTQEEVPVSRNGRRVHGKGAVSDCVDYYHAHTKSFESYSSSSTLPLGIGVVVRKNYKEEGFTNIVDKNEVEDVLYFSLTYIHTFPEPVSEGMISHYGHKATRTFAFSPTPVDILYKPEAVVQEFHPSIMLNGVQHQNVYHLYLQSPQYTTLEEHLHKHYPISFVKGIYIKEGIGVIQAYTNTGQQFNISPL